MAGPVKNRMLWHIPKWFLSSSCCQKHEGIFLQYSHFRTWFIQFLEVKLTKVVLPSGVRAPGFFSSQSCPLRTSSNSWIIFSSSLPPTARDPMEVAVPVSCNSLYSAFCLSLQFGGRSLPCGLTSLMDLKGVVGFFQFVQCFTCCYDGLSTSKLLMCWIITQKSITDYFVGFIRV